MKSFLKVHKAVKSKTFIPGFRYLGDFANVSDKITQTHKVGIKNLEYF